MLAINHGGLFVEHRHLEGVGVVFGVVSHNVVNLTLYTIVVLSITHGV